MNCKCGSRMIDVGTSPGGLFVRWCPICGRLHCRSMNPRLPGEYWKEPETVAETVTPNTPKGGGMNFERTWTDNEVIALMKEEAKGLLDDPPGTNPEYERALCELIARVGQRLGLSGNTAETARKVGEEIGGAWK